MLSIPREVRKLEELAALEGLSPAARGRAFEKLCADLLKAMGFTAVFRRRGSEQGRDIDAEHSGTKWYFECKCHARQVSTSQVAYKFLQLDLLPAALQPDFFVIMSNAGVASILRDLIAFRNAESHVRYCVAAWTNEPDNPLFEDILLSYPDVYLAHIGPHFGDGSTAWRRLVEDFRARSSRRRESHALFFEGWRANIPVLRKRDAPSGDRQHAWHAMHEVFRTCAREHPGLVQVTAGIPCGLVGALYDFRRPGEITTLSRMLQPWGVVRLNINDYYVEFGEPGDLGTRTYLFEWGSIAVVSSLLALKHLLRPDEWLKALRENCLRMRNFCKRGILPTPVEFRATIAHYGMKQGVAFGWRVSDLYIGGVRRFLPENSELSAEPCSELDRLAPSGEVASDVLRVESPFDMHDEIGRPLATSLWRNAGMPLPLLAEADSVCHEMVARPRDGEGRMGTRMFDLMVEFNKSFGWLREGEAAPRPYSLFEGMLY